MTIDLSRFHEIFFQEAGEHIRLMEAGLLALEQAGETSEPLNEIFRAAHSIKGGSATFGFEDIARFTHAMENLLDRMRAGKLEPERARIDVLLRAVDVLKELVAAARTGGAAPAQTDQVRNLLVVAQRTGFDPASPGRPRELDRPTAEVAPNQPSLGETIYRIRFAPSADVFRQGMDPVLVLRSLARLGRLLQTDLEPDKIPPLAELDPETCYLAWNLRLASVRPVEEIRDAFAFVEDGAVIAVEAETARDAPPAPPPAPMARQRGMVREAASIRVATDKVDRLIDLVGELVIAQSMAAQILGSFSLASLARLQETFAAMERYTRELQERVMGVRMLPVGTVFSRFPRLVRDLAASTGKKIALRLAGEDTELDKVVVERMSDPLTHLIRNAIDHGIEPPDHRRAAGKPEEGRIGLRAYHQGGNVIVEVTDDGRGLDPARIRTKAVERGLIGQSETLTEQETFALLFLPGFSTAAAVSDLSGRGVGMDVVKREVESLNGAVSVENRPTGGACVRIKLPLTLAILDGLLLRVGAQTYILPLIQILESIRPRREQMNTMAGQGDLVVVRNEPVPLLRLYRLLGVPGAVDDPSQGLVVLVEHQGRRLALLVDDLLGQQQVVIKSLETHYRKVDGIAGATILGDGQAALILDIAGLAQMARGSGTGLLACLPQDDRPAGLSHLH